MDQEIHQIQFQLEQYMVLEREKVFMDLISQLLTIAIWRYMKPFAKQEQDSLTKYCKRLINSSKIKFHHLCLNNTAFLLMDRLLTFGLHQVQFGKSKEPTFKYFILYLAFSSVHLWNRRCRYKQRNWIKISKVDKSKRR